MYSTPIEVTNDSESETGRLIQMPFNSKKRGRMSRQGARNSSWRVRERKIDSLALPMDWKKLPTTIWKPRGIPA